jgi:CubicO group peptidase (beta-lactamase class C family)
MIVGFRKIAIGLLAVLCLFSAVLTGGRLQAETGQKYREAIRDFEIYLKGRMEFDRAVGIAVGFVKDGFQWTNGYGFADLENNTPMKPNGSFRMASITKTFTAIGILQLVEKGKIDLDAEVQQYVPYFPRKKWPVTIRLLLGHLGGISHYRNYEKEGRIKVYKNTREALEIFSGFDLVAEPGTRYQYSSYGYNLLGAVLESASGQTYANYIKENIFKPLGMKDSRIDDPEDIIRNRVRGYRIIDDKIENSEFVHMSSRFAGGGTRSTVEDLLKYAGGIMAGTLLKEETTRMMFTGMATRAGMLTGYGMGWFTKPLNGHFQVAHGGAQAETRTFILILPRLNFAAAIASNMEDTNPSVYLNQLCEMVLGEDQDSAVYTRNKETRFTFLALSRVYSYGIAYYERFGKPLTDEPGKLKKAFAFFNKWADKNVLKKKFKEAKKMISSGIHPASNQAFTVIGSYMAAALAEVKGKDVLAGYHRKGYFKFVDDYIAVSRQWPDEKKDFRFASWLEKRLPRWQKDWNRTYTDYVRKLAITGAKELKEIGPRMGKTFAGAEIYPDLIRVMLPPARSLLLAGKEDDAMEIFSSCSRLYPESVSVLSHLAFGYLWTGNEIKAAESFKKAYRLEPEHPVLGILWFNYIRDHMVEKKKTDVLIKLAPIALDLFPRKPAFTKLAGDIYLDTGNIKKAEEYYRKAISEGLPFSQVKGIAERLEKAKKHAQ